MNHAKVTAASVLLVRIPGSLESVGMCMQVGPPGKPSWLYQLDMDGNYINLGSVWAHVDLESHAAEVLEEHGGHPEDIILREGFLKWMLGKEWRCSRWNTLCDDNKMRSTRRSRKERIAASCKGRQRPRTTERRVGPTWALL